MVMLRKSEEKYESALDDFSKGRYDSCVSNLYYSAFQATTAYMIQQGVLANKHRQVRSFVNKELAKTGLITRESAKLYNRLMDQRSDADYDVQLFEEDEAEGLLTGTKKLLDEIHRLID
ncbi:hypothetical protein AN477_01695 [Alicyclobacillus ferrooxydans]|uniref:HEPN domain-containing protein n=2 Tax=Alicyclobacillus ferrooxydans TaxID=471514 RepID=A0A0P9GWP3_9BACL|nr:hypothetical protein AN477_01695 [Alicyclobacillus ferrooxydans]